MVQTTWGIPQGRTDMAEPKIVFSDVDGTIVDGVHHPMPADAPTFARLAERGVPVCLVSARSPEGVESVRSRLGIVGAMACFSGAYVLGPHGEELVSRTISLEAAAEIKDFLVHDLPQVVAATYGFHTWVVDDRTDPRNVEEEYFVQAQATQCADVRAAFDERGIHKFLLMGEPAQILRARDVVRERHPEVTAVLSRPELCEIMAGGVSKADAVHAICECYGATPEEAIAFGDGENDLEMMGAVGTSYAMANAVSAVKEAATHVCPWSNVEGGVARTLAEVFDL